MCNQVSGMDVVCVCVNVSVCVQQTKTKQPKLIKPNNPGRSQKHLLLRHTRINVHNHSGPGASHFIKSATPKTKHKGKMASQDRKITRIFKD